MPTIQEPNTESIDGDIETENTTRAIEQPILTKDTFMSKVGGSFYFHLKYCATLILLLIII